MRVYPQHPCPGGSSPGCPIPSGLLLKYIRMHWRWPSWPAFRSDDTWHDPRRQSLAKRVFAVCLRLVTRPGDPGILPKDAQAAILVGQRLIDVPKLMDLCALFAPWSPSLCLDLVGRAVRLLPGLLDDLGLASRRLAQNFADVQVGVQRPSRLLFCPAPG